MFVTFPAPWIINDVLLPGDHCPHSLQSNNNEVWHCYESDEDEDGTFSQTRTEDSTLKLVFWQAMYKVSNSAITCLLHFMKYFIKLIGQAFKFDAATRASGFIPVTATTVYHNLLLDCSQSFIEYVVCPKCDCIYEFKDCYIQTGTNSRLSKTCCHIAFPDHPHMSRRTQCF